MFIQPYSRLHRGVLRFQDLVLSQLILEATTGCIEHSCSTFSSRMVRPSWSRSEPRQVHRDHLCISHPTHDLRSMDPCYPCTTHLPCRSLPWVPAQVVPLVPTGPYQQVIVPLPTQRTAPPLCFQARADLRQVQRAGQVLLQGRLRWKALMQALTTAWLGHQLHLYQHSTPVLRVPQPVAC